MKRSGSITRSKSDKSKTKKEASPSLSISGDESDGPHARGLSPSHISDSDSDNGKSAKKVKKTPTRKYQMKRKPLAGLSSSKKCKRTPARSGATLSSEAQSSGASSSTLKPAKTKHSSTPALKKPESSKKLRKRPCEDEEKENGGPKRVCRPTEAETGKEAPVLKARNDVSANQQSTIADDTQTVRSMPSVVSVKTIEVKKPSNVIEEENNNKNDFGSAPDVLATPVPATRSNENSQETNSGRRVHFDFKEEPRPGFARKSLIASLDALDVKKPREKLHDISFDKKPSSAPVENAQNELDFKHIFPELINCSKPAKEVYADIIDLSATRGAQMLFAARKIETVGDLARLSRSEIQRMPFLPPKVPKLRQVLEFVAKIERGMKPINEDTYDSLSQEPSEHDSLESNDVPAVFVDNRVTKPIMLEQEGMIIVHQPAFIHVKADEPQPIVTSERSTRSSSPDLFDSPDDDAVADKEVEESEALSISSEETESSGREEQDAEEGTQDKEENINPEPEIEHPAPSVFAGIELVGQVWTKSLEAITDANRTGPNVNEGVAEFAIAAQNEFAKDASKTFGDLTYDQLVLMRRLTRDMLFSFANLLDDEFQKQERKFMREA
ncbi:hypothetical protein L596_008090 [Steinernema carpocapsae]|uniref:Uncharacterized protein n=1 Tax=Steinernema carpocapsae TaxID=34508 RepID=A0A4U5PBH6_STECR|nr:hypothetical protein L596_008090 [Steinernema carpocapsae]